MVLIADTVHPILLERLQEEGFELLRAENMPLEQIDNILPEVEGLIIRSRFPMDAARIGKATNLKFIGRVGAGLENIDMMAAGTAGITVVNAPEGNRDAVGEHALGMLLMLMNKLRFADSEVRRGIWRREENRGYELSGKTVGIIGYGRMGSAFAEKLQGFRGEVLAHDIEEKPIDLPYVKQTNLEEIYQKADVLSLHLPQKEDTIYYFDEDFLKKMQRPFYLINTARGKVVKTSAVVKGLENGKILGACLDVLEFEKSSFENLEDNKLPADFRYLVKSDKVILSPHIAGWTVESNQKLAEIVADKIVKLYRNEP